MKLISKPLIVCGALLALVACTAFAESRPNIVYLMSDDQNFG